MFDIRWIRDNPSAFDAARERRGLPAISAELIALDDRRREAIGALQRVQERRNAAAKAVGQAMSRQDRAEAERLKAEVAGLKATFGDLEADERQAGEWLNDALSGLPNLPLDDVPAGRDEHDNVEVRRWGEPPHAFAAGQQHQEHYALGESLGLMEFDTAARISGSRFVVLRGAMARLSRALGQFMLDLHTTRHGYEEIDPPLMVRDAAMFGTAQLPKFRDDQFRAGEDHWLIPTAEVPLTNLVRERVLDEGELPLRLTALTPSFRAEAGSAGRDTRGMIRQHQFEKVELVSITTPETSLAEHERMTGCAEQVLQRLGLHYRVMLLCGGDMGFSARKTYDIEVWLPGQGRFREISSCSVCGDFQARRMDARFRPAGAKTPRFVHTLNGSGVAVGRALVAVLEAYQQPDGTVVVPEVLRPYMGGLSRIERAAA